MAKRDPVPFTTPVGRLVGGNPHKPKLQTDNNGQPKLIKSGEKQGQPLYMYDVAIAVPKDIPRDPAQPHLGMHRPASFQEHPGWGQTIAAEAAAAWPGGQTQRPDFAWKIIDGDSTVPNKVGKRPCDRDGYPGHWVLWFSGMGAPVILTTIGTPGGAAQQSTQDGLINLGDYIQVGGSVSGNDSAQTAGLYLNHNAVCLRGYGPRIAASVDVASFGFGAAPLPAGASMVPVGGDLPQTAAAPAAPVAPPPAAAQIPVTPLPPTLPPVPPAAPAAPTRVWRNAEWTYEQLAASGWTDQQMRDAGYLA